MTREHVGIDNASAGTAKDDVCDADGGDTDSIPKAGGTISPLPQ